MGNQQLVITAAPITSYRLLKLLTVSKLFANAYLLSAIGGPAAGRLAYAWLLIVPRS
jgi:hypothetical protein